MNLVKEILDQLSGSTLGQLGALVGTDEDTAGYATSAAVPALLAGLASVASSGDGANKAAAVLRDVGSSSTNDVTAMLRGDADTVAQRGSSLLGTLLGDNMVSNLVGSLGKYSGLASGGMKKLLALLAPLVLGKVASAWQSRGGTHQALTGLLAEQRSNIADAMPGGFSLADVPGLSLGRTTASAPADANRRAAATAGTATRSASSWIVPLALALLGAFLLLSFFNRRADRNTAADRTERSAQEVTAMKPVAPALEDAAVARANEDLRKLFASAREVMGNIKDAASAEKALPQLEKLSAEIDATKKLLQTMPSTAVQSVRAAADKPIAEIRELATKTLETPGLAEEIRLLINGILQKLTKLFA